MKFRRRSIPKPLQVNLPPIPDSPRGIHLPYHMAAIPRQFLIWLANHSELAERQRELIAEWILNFDSELVAWLLLNYGYGGLVEADAISKELAAQFGEAVHNEYKRHETDLLSRLEEDMKDSE